MDLKEILEKQKILPIYCPKNETEAITLAEGAIGAGIKTVEIIIRSDYALDGIKYIKKHYPELTIGGGTVINEELIDAASDAGADYFVSPGYSENLVNKARKMGIPFLPGCSTPSEIQNALMNGITLQKYFPAGLPGKMDSLKLYSSAFSDVSFVLTGKISLDNYAQFLALDNIVACGGGFMLKKDAIERGDSKSVSEFITECLGRCPK